MSRAERVQTRLVRRVPGCEYEVAVLSPEGSSRRITDDARFETAPSWTRDGDILSLLAMGIS